MKKILLVLLFVVGFVWCENVPTYQVYLKERELKMKMEQTNEARRAAGLHGKQQLLSAKFHAEIARCEMANDCENSQQLKYLFGEMLQASFDAKEAFDEVTKSPEGRELQALRDLIVSTLRKN